MLRPPLLLLALAWALPSLAWAASASGPLVADVARTYRDTRPSLSVEACNGLVEDVLSDAGIDTPKGPVRTHYAEAKARGWLHHRKVPEVGDIVFFDDTYDKDRNGRQDDPLSHIAVVISVDDDGTVQMVHRGSKGIRPLSMHLGRPHDRRDEAGKILNSYLGAPGYAKEGHKLAGELWRAFATPTGASRAAVAAVSTARPSMVRRPGRGAAFEHAPVAVEDGAFVRVWAGRRLHRAHLDGRSCRELWFLRNAVYARHGFRFQHPDGVAAFALVPDYRAVPGMDRAAVAGRLTRRDLDNLEALSAYEERCAAP